MALDIAKIVGTHIAVGAIAAVPIPGSMILAQLAQPQICFHVLGESTCSYSTQYEPLRWTKPISALVGKAAAIAALATLLALGVITGPVGIGFAIAGIITLGLCILGLSAVLGINVYNSVHQYEDRTDRREA